jgi:DNA-binding MarR family transcriptional regulator
VVAVTGAMADRRDGGWTFVTTHTLVLLCIAEDAGIRLSEVAAQVGITERRVQSIVADLVTEGYLTRTRQGRRNRYHIDRSRPLRHAETEHRLVGELLSLLT